MFAKQKINPFRDDIFLEKEIDLIVRVKIYIVPTGLLLFRGIIDSTNILSLPAVRQAYGTKKNRNVVI
jgi:hypothetical protein